MKKTVLGAIGVLALAASQTAAADWAFRPKVGISSTSYTLKIDDTKYKSTYSPLSYGGTLLFDGWFIDATFSSGDGDIDNSNLEFDRKEQTYMIGTTGGGASWYVGYTSSESEFTGPGGVIRFKPSGFITGLSVDMFDFDNGALNWSLGLALLDAEMDSRVLGVTMTDSASTYSFGYSAGIGYGHQVAPGLTVRGDIKYNHYTLEFDTWEATESYTHYTLSAAYVF